MDEARRKRIGDHIVQMGRDAASGSGDKPQRVSMAKIQLELAEEASDSASKLERFTFWLIVLTVALIVVGIVQIVLMLYGHQ